MSLKRLIHYRKQFLEACNYEFTIPGEPLIFSFLYHTRKRWLADAHYRNVGWKSFLRCVFRGEYRFTRPVVVFVRFYVSPPNGIDIHTRTLKNEKTVATDAHELCDYLMSFLEMVKMALLKDYRQIVKIDAEKYYSDKPRTVMKFIRHETYVELLREGHLQPDSQAISKNKSKPLLQPEQEGDGSAGLAGAKAGTWGALTRSLASGDAFPDTDEEELVKETEGGVPPNAPCDEA